MESINSNIDFSRYRNVFCDSREALEWAYQRGLPNDAIIRTSSPALLFSGDGNIQNVEQDWSTDKIREFHSGMLAFSEEVFNALNGVHSISRGMALGVAQEALRFQTFLYKAACLKEDDLVKKRLFIKINGYGGVRGNNMNSPWDELLINNRQFTITTYTLQDYSWAEQSIKSVSLLDRIRFSGIETIIYRIAIKLSKWIPDFLFKGEVFIIKENELIIEAAAHLLKKRISIKELKCKEGNADISYNQPNIKKLLLPILKSRIEPWVDPGLVNICLEHMLTQVDGTLFLINKYHILWASELSHAHIKTKILSSSVANAQGNALYDVCREKKIPVISVLHGVTHELSKLITVNSPFYDMAASDICLTHTDISAREQQNSLFAVGLGIAVGLPSRTLRMKKYYRTHKYDASILYVSTNLYKGCLAGPVVDLHTDFNGFEREYKVASMILSMIPHKVCYKTYPEENRRFSDVDPIEQYINRANNMTLIKEKVDMRYLLSGFKVIITSGATSTLGWAVMTDKPIVFINWSTHNPLTDDAYKALNEGLFLFNGDSEYFHQELKFFLSESIDNIYKAWDKKSQNRIKMIEKYFSKNISNIGAIAANTIEKVEL